jgi:Flp pilus assembly protein TadG
MLEGQPMKKMIGPMIGRKKNQQGQATVEFALTIVFLLMVIFGLVEFARWFNAYLTVQFAARETARYAISGRPTRGECAIDNKGAATYRGCRVAYIQEVARNLSGASLLANESITDASSPYFLGVIVASVEGGEGDPGGPKEKVQITVVYNHPVLNPLMSAVWPTIRVIGNVQMINEPWAGGGDVNVPNPVPPAVIPPLDSDGDGWSDTYEVNTSGTLPGNPDTDGDGIEDPSDPCPLDPTNSC